MVFTVLILVVLGTAAAALACHGLQGRERRLAMAAYAVHVVSSFLYWGMEELLYGKSDSYSYLLHGTDLARLLDADFLRFAPEVLKCALHQDHQLPFEVSGDGLSTGTMSAIAGFFIFGVGPSLLPLGLVTTWISWFGQLCLYRVARQELPAEDHAVALAGTMFVPSVVFWGAGFAKEALVLGFLGVLLWSTQAAWRRRAPLHIPGIIFGATGVAVLKPYTLFPFVLAISAFLYADRAWRGGTVRIRPVYLALAVALATAGVLGAGSLFPEFATDKVAESLSAQQELWHHTDGGSGIEMGSDEARTIPQQLMFAPLALFNAFFRPAVFEAKSAPAFGAAIETTLITLAALSLLVRGRRQQLVASFIGSPFLVASGLFVLVFAVAVGLATSNLGSLSRYRVPMMPFYVTTLLVLRRRTQEARAPSPARGEGSLPLPYHSAGSPHRRVV